MRNREPREGMFSRRTNQVGKQLQDNHSLTANKTHLKELPSICMKKQKLYLPPLEACTGVERTLAPVEERGMRHLKVAAHTRKLHPKIHAAASPRASLDEKCMHLNKRTRKSTSSSVASCSTSNKPCRLSHTINSSTEDAESSFVSESLPLLPTEEAIKAEIHRLELCAYRAMLVAFHASGSISWEQEALMTNLRLMLHISTDEHLLELKKLALGKSRVSSRQRGCMAYSYRINSQRYKNCYIEGDCKELIDWIHEEAPNPTPYEEFKSKGY